jgi:hypothetical protein
LTVKASFDAPLGFNFCKPKGLDSEKPPAVCRLRSAVKKKSALPVYFLKRQKAWTPEFVQPLPKILRQNMNKTCILAGYLL